MSQVVHCPKCKSAVTVSAAQSGQRVQCPSCQKQFLAPASLGVAGATQDDDDWLVLEDPPASASTPQSEVPPSPKSPAASPKTTESDPFDVTPGPANSRPDETSPKNPLESDDPFTLGPVASRAPASFGTEDGGAANLNGSNLFGDLPPVDSSAPQSPSASPSGSPSASTDDFGDLTAAVPTSTTVKPAVEEEFRVNCPVCGTVLYAKVHQVGKSIKCSDCHSQIEVPEAPAKKLKAKPSANSESFQFASDMPSERPTDPFKRSADDLLREAAKEPEEPKPGAMFEAPSTIGWFKTVFGIFLDPGVLLHFFGLAISLGFIAALTRAVPLFALGTVPLGLLGIFLTVACGFAILYGVANGQKRIEDWPTADPVNWFDSIFLVIAATSIAVGPAYVLGTLLGAHPLLKLALVMLCVYAAFPFILLSMLDMQSVTTPFSQDVAKSINRCNEDWGAFYFSSGVLFAVLFMYFQLCSYEPFSIGLGVALSVAVIFLYSAMLGRLAVAISEVVGLAALDPEEDPEAEENGTENS